MGKEAVGETGRKLEITAKEMVLPHLQIPRGSCIAHQQQVNPQRAPQDRACSTNQSLPFLGFRPGPLVVRQDRISCAQTPCPRPPS